ncbi:MAG: hypothetical protein ACT4PV_04815 [Planctomycetaceae bacterium]
MTEKKLPDGELATSQERRETGLDRRAGADRRERGERRKEDVAVSVERRSGKDRRHAGPAGERRKVERRINEYVLEADVLEFINAVNDYKTRQQRPFPTWSEIYRIFVGLGYRRGDE